MQRFLVAAILLTGMSVSTSSQSAEITHQPGPDEGTDVWVTDIYYDYGSDDENLRIGGWADYYYGLLKFDLSNLPKEATSARILLWSPPYPEGKFSTVSMKMDRLVESWDENTRWGNRPPSAAVETNLPAPAPNVWYEINITGLYNDWQSGVVPNYGVQLRPRNNHARMNFFLSSDYVADPSLRPKLVVEYESDTPQHVLSSDRPIDRSLPTVVLTHGFRFEDRDNFIPDHTGTPFSNAMYTAVDVRLQKSEISANVIAFMWEEAFVESIITVPSLTPSVGEDLAISLMLVLGENYTNNNDIHFIGHSYGTLVNAHAIRFLVDTYGWTVSQVTVLDAPTDAPLGFGGVVAPMEEYYRIPRSPHVTWFDNYYGMKSEGPRGVGGPITGAAPNGGKSLNQNHPGVWQWYRDTITNEGKRGFWYSAVLGDSGGFSSRPTPQFWEPLTPDVRKID